MYVKHQKSINPDVVAIYMSAFKPLTEMWEANINFHHLNEMIKKGVKVPEFRFEALEEQFVQKTTRMGEIFRDYGRLDFPFDIRQMLTVLKIENWKDIHPFSFYLQPLEDAVNDVVKELLDMLKAGHLRSKYVLQENTELQDKFIHMVRLDVTCQCLLGDELKQDQLKFIYNVHKTIYDTGLKDAYVDSKKNEFILQNVVPSLTALHSLITIMEIEDARQADVDAAE
jgi:phage terminase small subunit